MLPPFRLLSKLARSVLRHIRVRQTASQRAPAVRGSERRIPLAGDFSVAKGGLWYGPDMSREAIIARLRECETELKAHGVTHAALFGSAARNQQGPESDIDILVHLDPEVVATMFDYAGLKAYVANLFQGPVDVIDREALKPRLRPHVTADAIYAF